MSSPDEDMDPQSQMRDREKDIYNFLKTELSSQMHGGAFLSIVLTDGDIINGIFDEPSNDNLSIFLMYSQLDFDLPHTNPYIHSSYIYFFIDIPLKDIAGIEQVDITFKDERHKTMGYTKIFCTNTIKRAEKHGFAIKWVPAYGIGIGKFEWDGLIKINNNELLYADWDLIENDKSVISFGLNLPIITINIPLQKKLRSMAIDKIKSKPITIEQTLKSSPNVNLKETNFVNVEGFVEFIDEKKIDLGGKSWIPAFVCDKKIENIEGIKKSNWILGIFQEDKIIFNKKTMQACSNLRIFGELMTTSIDTDIGRKNLVLKAIVAGFITT